MAPNPDTERIFVLGIRHHGPGSARSVVAELDRIRPGIVAIEGPADADPVLSLAAGPGMEPPVALLAYDPSNPRVSAFWPFAVFSPEWQALTWALRHDVPVRFCDLPASVFLAAASSGDEEEREAAVAESPIRSDEWWDSVVESRVEGEPPFAELTEAMAVLRSGAEDPPRERRREAHMRQVLRAALKATGGPVAVVCGAWHAPALVPPLPPASRDAALLRGMPRKKAALAWVPWTHSRLSMASGYGAGIASPGWYHHLFAAGDQVTERWMTRVAGVLRRRDLPVSSAHVIEAVRLATALAALRNRPRPGLDEVTEATRAVLCDGSDTVLSYVTRDLVVGERLGSVPPGSPPVPLDADLRARARSLRLRPDASEKTLSLDLRREIDRGRSEFLHSLLVLGIGWGTPAEDPVRNTGTFRETWSLRWRPELAVAIIDAAGWGTTVPSAAVSRLAARASDASSLASVTSCVLLALLAGLPGALDPVLRALDARAAADTDVADLMNALPPLARAIRYGNVRGTPAASLVPVADALTARICAGLPAAAGGLGDDAAARLRSALDGAHAALALLSSGGATPRTPRRVPGETAKIPDTQPRPGTSAQSRWLEALGAVERRRDVHGLIAGRVTRLLADASALPWPSAALRFRAALSAGVAPAAKAAWAEGFLAGSGLLLVHDRDLLAVLDAWVSSLPDEEFTQVLPLMRRTFGGYESGELAGIGRAVRSLGDPVSRVPGPRPIDEQRAAGALRTVALILGSGSS